MNRYPWWKYAILAVALLVGLLYTLPNFFGEAPAVQVSQRQGHAEGRRRAWSPRVEQALKAAGIERRLRAVRGQLGQGALRRHRHPDQGQGRASAKALNPDPADPSYIVALNLLSRSPAWLTAHARAAHVPGPGPARRRALPDAGRHEGGADQEGRGADRRHPHRCCATRTCATPASPATATAVDVRFRDARHADAARDAADRPAARPAVDRDAPTAPTSSCAARLKPEAARAVQEQALKQNITTLHNRVNELGVAEPVIQQQGAGPHRGAAARRAGHRQGQGHPRPHRHAGSAHGRRQRRGRAAERRQRPGAVRHRALRRARRRAADRQAPGRR